MIQSKTLDLQRQKGRLLEHSKRPLVRMADEWQSLRSQDSDRSWPSRQTQIRELTLHKEAKGPELVKKTAAPKFLEVAAVGLVDLPQENAIPDVDEAAGITKGGWMLFS